MPLSEHEQKLLDQMERALYAEDPSFATQMGRPRVASRTRLLVGVLAGVAGLVIVLLGVNAASIPLGVVGFVVMVAGVAWAFTPHRAAAAGQEGVRPQAARRLGKRKGSRGKKSGGSIMGRMDERWDKRRRDGSM